MPVQYENRAFSFHRKIVSHSEWFLLKFLPKFYVVIGIFILHITIQIGGEGDCAVKI